MDDITAIYYTANAIDERFAESIRNNLIEVLEGLPIISVSKSPIPLGINYTVDTPRSHLNIYRQALLGVKKATSKYVVFCEDDVLYSPEHFKHRPLPGKFAYNLGVWMLFTWGRPMLSHKGGGRRNLAGLICERELFIEAMEERFAKYPVDEEVNLSLWAEPGKYERQLGVTVRETEVFYTNPPNVVFSHQTALSYANLGHRKKLGEMRALSIPYWGRAEDLIRIYDVRS